MYVTGTGKIIEHVIPSTLLHVSLVFVILLGLFARSSCLLHGKISPFFCFSTSQSIIISAYRVFEELRSRSTVMYQTPTVASAQLCYYRFECSPLACYVHTPYDIKTLSFCHYAELPVAPGNQTFSLLNAWWCGSGD